MSVNSLSVFFPCINEEGNIENIVQKAEEVLKKLKLKYEIIIVDDGSTDSTGQIADTLAEKNSNIRVIHHPKNLGYGEALKSGFYNARYDTIVYTDGDGQFDFAEVTKFLDEISDHDLVIGYRIKRKDPLFRILFKKGWAASLWTFFGLTLKDVDCGFKMVRKEVLQKIPHLESSRGAMINAELAIKIKKMGFKIAQVGVTHYPRLIGNPTGANIQVIIKSYLDLLKLWWKLKDEKVFFILLLLIIVLASFLRLYKIDQYMIFLGDQGRDALIVRDMVIIHHFPLIGPPTSVGNIYLGPFYYYMMFLPMALFGLNPVAASVMVAFVGVAIVITIYYLGKIWFGRAAGLISSFLYAISPVNINYSNFSWNPNPAPFFALLSVFGLYKLHKSGNFLWLILTGAAIAATSQLHYLALILVPIAIVLWIYEIVFRRNFKKQIKNFLSGSFLGISAFLAVMSPLVIFDLRHDFLNYKAITKLFTGGSAVKADIFANISRIPSLFSYNLIGRYMTAEYFYVTLLLSFLIIFALLYKFSYWPKLALAAWLIIGLFGLTFYQQNIYDHYLGFLNPTPYLLFGSLAAINLPINFKKWWNLTLIILVLFLAVLNLQKNPLLYPPNNQLLKTQNVAKFIIGESGGRTFNFALLSKNNYDSAYQFYLDLYGHKPKQVPFEVTDQLFVVCEDPVCDAINNAKYEIADFGMAKIANESDVYGVKVLRLIHNPTGKP